MTAPCWDLDWTIKSYPILFGLPEDTGTSTRSRPKFVFQPVRSVLSFEFFIGNKCNIILYKKHL